VPAPVRVFSWTGCYIGGNIGWGWGRDTVSIPNVAEITGEPELAGVSAPSETGNTSGVLGGGIEWAFWNNCSAKVEYDYYDFSTSNLSLGGTIAGVPEVLPGVNIKEIIQTVKVGINYRFAPY
jgi:outer membrane immunogenic protein